MKNFKKVIFALMVVFLVVGFIGCKTESDPPKAPVVTNNFKGNVFVAEYSEESDSGIWGYIEFIDDTNGKMGISNYDEESNPIITDQPFTYSVTDDVATIKATMYGREVTVTTSKLTDGIFTFSTEYEDSTVLVTCTKGDKSLFDVWTVYYDEEEVMKDFFYEFEDYVKLLVEGDDYSKDEATKTITLTASGWAKVQDAMGGGSEDEEGGSSTGGNTGNDNPGNTDTPETPVVTNNFKGNVFVAVSSVESWSGIWGYIEFIDETNGKMGIPNYDEESNPIITEQPFTYSVTDDVATLKATMEGEEFTVTTSKLDDGIFTFSTEDVDTETGETISILMTCTKGDKSLFDVWTVCYEEEDLMKDFFYEFEDYVELLVEEDDYSKDDATKTITLTVSGYEKVQAAMGGGSEEEGSGEVTGETWTVLNPAGDFLESFDSLEAAQAYAEENGLTFGDDFTMNNENYTITLTDAGWDKVQAAMGDTEGGDSGEVYYYMHNGELYGGQNTLEDFLYEVELYDLVEGTDYEIDHENMCINFTDSGCAKLEG